MNFLTEEKENKSFLKYRENISILKKDIEDVCKNSGRSPDDIIVIAATKYVGPEGVAIVHKLGINDFGENRSDELLKKKKFLFGDSKWHFIGHLQSRKAKIVVPLVEYIHSIDSLKTMEKVGKEAKKINKVQKVLMEVNISGEQTKYGLGRDQVSSFISDSSRIKNINMKGFMAMAPYTDDTEYIRKIFKSLRLLREEMSGQYGGLDLSELSMGMSNDFRIAIEEGATMIRIGSNIFN
ncbi:YggS family pyridoxal phosphate-dependent enzyme [Actinomycetota bacterium]